MTTTGQERLPLQSLGDGMVRLFHILIAMREAAGGMILLDEVENGLHHSILAEVWKRIRSLATKLEVQVFATTHSLECLDAAIAAFEDKPDDLGRAQPAAARRRQPVVAASFRGEALLGARESTSKSDDAATGCRSHPDHHAAFASRGKRGRRTVLRRARESRARTEIRTAPDQRSRGQEPLPSPGAARLTIPGPGFFPKARGSFTVRG